MKKYTPGVTIEKLVCAGNNYYILGDDGNSRHVIESVTLAEKRIWSGKFSEQVTWQTRSNGLKCLAKLSVPLNSLDGVRFYTRRRSFLLTENRVVKITGKNDWISNIIANQKFSTEGVFTNSPTYVICYVRPGEGYIVREILNVIGWRGEIEYKTIIVYNKHTRKIKILDLADKNIKQQIVIARDEMTFAVASNDSVYIIDLDFG